MEKKKITYTVLLIFLAMVSCVKEGPDEYVVSEAGNRIFFRSNLPNVSETRSDIISMENLTECRVTCINPYDATLIKPESGEMKPYFSDICFEKDAEGRFVAIDKDTTIWPDTRSRIHFFAYYPPVENMQKTIDSKKFNLVNYSVSSGGTTTISYRLENFKVAHDIADQVDFIAAYSTGTKKENQGEGIELKFSHQLARIELSAWNANDKYNFEIAGVRIGNPVTQGDFDFTSLSPASGSASSWSYASGNQSNIEHIFSEGESTVFLRPAEGKYSDKDHPASIMGNAGPAMVIPMAEKIDAWKVTDGNGPGVVSDSKDKLYFSVLLRVTNKANETVYPFPNDRDNIPVTYFAIGSEGKIIKSVYEKNGEFYTVEGSIYTAAPGEEIRGFCWAALPVSAKWEAGKIYTYKLNYTTGIGLHDPSGPIPGEPILERGHIPFEVSVSDWIEADGRDPNIEVPK